jgi:CheY-like chemotaxis protein
MAKFLLKAQSRRRLTRPESVTIGLRTVWQSSAGDVLEEVPIRNIESPDADFLAPRSVTPRASRSRRRLEETGDGPLPRSLRGRETILVVDESALMREAVAGNLRLLGYRVLEAAGAQEAQHCAHAQRNIHLAVIDLPTPEIKRFELAQWFRAIYPGTKLLLSTDWLWGLNLDLDSQRRIVVLAKPFTPLELARMVRLVLDDVDPNGNFPRK